MSLCDTPRIQALVAAIQSGADAIDHIDQVLVDFPADARLHFMRGSSLASAGRLIEKARNVGGAARLFREIREQF